MCLIEFSFFGVQVLSLKYRLSSRSHGHYVSEQSLCVKVGSGLQTNSESLGGQSPGCNSPQVPVGCWRRRWPPGVAPNPQSVQVVLPGWPLTLTGKVCCHLEMVQGGGALSQKKGTDCDLSPLELKLLQSNMILKYWSSKKLHLPQINCKVCSISHTVNLFWQRIMPEHGVLEELPRRVRHTEI